QLEACANFGALAKVGDVVCEGGAVGGFTTRFLGDVGAGKGMFRGFRYSQGRAESADVSQAQLLPLSAQAIGQLPDKFTARGVAEVNRRIDQQHRDLSDDAGGKVLLQHAGAADARRIGWEITDQIVAEVVVRESGRDCKR